MNYIREVRDTHYYQNIDGKEVHQLLESTFVNLFSIASKFFDETNTEFKKNFETYFMCKNPMDFKKEYYIAIELDDHTSLDVISDYDVSNKLENMTFRAIFPRHDDWKSHYFEKIDLTDKEVKFFKDKESKFLKEIEQLGLYGMTIHSEFNPERDLLPESLVDFQPKNDDFLGFVQDTERLTRFLELYYSYVEDMKKSFKTYEDIAYAK